MNRHHMTSKGPVPFTAEEETVRDAEELAWADAKPMEDWKSSMQGTDSGMPRYMEDLITDKFDGNAGPNLQVRYDTKIELRGTKP